MLILANKSRSQTNFGETFSKIFSRIVKIFPVRLTVTVLPLISNIVSNIQYMVKYIGTSKKQCISEGMVPYATIHYPTNVLNDVRTATIDNNLAKTEEKLNTLLSILGKLALVGNRSKKLWVD